METIPIDSRFQWARTQMPLVREFLDKLPNLKGMRLACSVHLDFKFLPVVEGLLEKGAKLFIVSCNPATVRHEVVDVIRSLGVSIDARQGMTEKQQQECIQRALAFDPTHLCEMGADLSYAVHQKKDAPTSIKASLEATNTGINRLRLMRLRYPIFNWNNVPLKTEMHNRVMVGLVTCHTFFERTQLTFHGKRVLVVGFGPVGEGVCRSSAAYGGKVMVCDTEEKAALRAKIEGYLPVTLEEGLAKADVVITATGSKHVLNKEHFSILKPGSFLMNVGHSSDEIDVESLKAYQWKKVLPHVDEISIDKKKVYLIAQGSMANLTAGMGDSLNSFDTTLCILVAGIGYMANVPKDLSPRLYDLPEEVWAPVDVRAKTIFC